MYNDKVCNSYTVSTYHHLGSMTWAISNKVFILKWSCCSMHTFTLIHRYINIMYSQDWHHTALETLVQIYTHKPCIFQTFVLSHLPKSSIKSSTLSIANSLDRFRP